MTKALVCGKCKDIRGLDDQGGWVICRCGNSEARWEDPYAGKVRVRAHGDRSQVLVIGLHNKYFLGAIEGPTHVDMVKAGGQWEWWRKLHDLATDAKGYIFDKEKRSCWATIVRPNETNDIKWEGE